MSARSGEKKAPKLKDFCSITSSKRIYAADYVEDGIPFVRGKEVVQRFSGSTPLESEIFISPTKFETLRNRFGAPTAGDLLLTSVGNAWGSLLGDRWRRVLLQGRKPDLVS